MKTSGLSELPWDQSTVYFWAQNIVAQQRAKPEGILRSGAQTQVHSSSGQLETQTQRSALHAFRHTRDIPAWIRSTRVSPQHADAPLRVKLCHRPHAL